MAKTTVKLNHWHGQWGKQWNTYRKTLPTKLVQSEESQVAEASLAFLLPKGIPAFQLTYIFSSLKKKKISNNGKYEDPKKINYNINIQLVTIALSLDIYSTISNDSDWMTFFGVYFNSVIFM